MLKSEIQPTMHTPARLLAVIVLYKMHPSDSPTLQTLLNAVKKTSHTELEIGIFIQDNTPGGQDSCELPREIRYEAAQGNPGLARAYNRALDIAQAEGYDWLLTLDQDTILPVHFLTRIAKLARTLESLPAIGAIVPQVIDGNRNLSPFRFALGAVPRWFSYGYVGISHRATYALNSAATLRVAALRRIGGYDPMFPLDVSDINVFHRLYHHGYEVFLAGDLCISHNFSLLNKHQRMSLERYRSMLWDECAFWDINMGGMARLERIIRLVGRVCKDLMIPEEAAFRKMTVTELRRRLVTSRANRITEWKNWATARSGLSDAIPDTRNTP